MSDEVKVRFNQSKQDVPYTKEVNGDVGFLNHMIRYGSPGALSGITEGEFGSFAEVRKYVLERSDATPEARAILERMFTYATQTIKSRDGRKIPLIPLNQPAVGFVRKKTEDINVSVKCPPAYKVIPSVRILDPQGRLLASNIDLVKDSSTGGFVVLREFSAELTNGKSVNAGITPLYQGTYELTYKFPQSIKGGTRQSVLAAIAQSPNGLGYVFATGREYTIEIKNIKPTGQIIPKKYRKNCDRLLDQSLLLRSSTLKQELVEWNPITNTAKFRITYLRSVNTRAEVDKDKITTLPTLVKNNELTIFDAVSAQLEKNKSVFQYERYTKLARSTRSAAVRSALGVDPARGPVREFRITNGIFGQRGGGIKLQLQNSFFLFRSILIATLQVFSEESSPFKDDPRYKNALLPKGLAEKLIIGIDESTVPNELGLQFDDPGIDVRSTYETLVVDETAFIDFYNDLSKRKNAIGFTDLMVEYFEKLPQFVFKRAIIQGVSPNLWFKSFAAKRSGRLQGEAATSTGGFVGSRRTPTPAQSGKILDNEGFGYMGLTSQKLSRGIKANFAKIPDLSKYKRTRKLYRVTEIRYEQGRQGLSTATVSETGMRSSLKTVNDTFGQLRIKSIPSKVLARSVAEAPISDPTPILLLSRNDSPTFSQEHFDPLVVQNLNATQRTSLGIVNVNWYDVLETLSGGEESFQFRLAFEGGTPFSFSTVDNKHLETQAALNTKGEGVQLKAHSVSFTLYDILSASPYITDFYFSPRFFGFKTQDDDLFGYAGYYKTNQVSISLSGDKSRFVTSVNAVVKLDPTRLKQAKTVSAIAAAEKKLDKISKKRQALLEKNAALAAKVDRLKKLAKAQGIETSEEEERTKKELSENVKEINKANKDKRDLQVKILKLKQERSFNEGVAQ